MIALVLAAALQGGPLDIQTVMARVNEHAATDARLRYEQHLTGTKRQSDQKGNDKPKESISRLEMMPDSIMERQLVDEGQPVTDAPLKRPQIDLIASMGTKYHVRLTSPKPIDGCYVVAFDPIDPDQDTDDEQEMIANHLIGTACIDQDHFFVRRVDARFPKSFTKSVVGKLISAKVTVTQEWVDGAARPQGSDSIVVFSKSFGIFTNTRRIKVTYEFDPLPTPTTVPAPSSP